MLNRESADQERIEQVILQAVRHILEYQDASRFLEWACGAIPTLLGLDADVLQPGEDRRLALLLATAIWNATPLPDQGFRPRPLALPRPDAPCPCGSGLSYARCCTHLDEVPDLPRDLIWELTLAELRPEWLKQAVLTGAVPDHLLGSVAERWLDEDRPGRAAALLEPLFDGSAAGLDDRFEPALNALCDAYDRLDHWKKKRDLLKRMTEHPCRGLRAAAWQRLATIHIDEGDFDQAEAAFTQALREGPDSPGTALLEITLLAAQHKDTLARERAVFWRRKLIRADLGEEAIIEFLTRAAQDPQDALITSQSAIIDPALLYLRDWIRAAGERPLPEYGLERFVHARDGELFGQLSLFSDKDTCIGYPSPSAGKEMRMYPPARLRKLETKWRAVFASPKPHSTRLTPLLQGDIWDRDDWIGFLQGHPEAADSLDILDDLATAVYMHPESSLPWIGDALLAPLLGRAHSILDRLTGSSTGRVIPWSIAENRPALRLLFRLYLFQAESASEDAADTLETLLKLNPRDNHGIRAELMNHYLRLGEDRKALELAGRFPEDTLADLAYGQVLAFYRLGEKSDAELALRKAVRRLPRIPQYLTRKRIRRPDPGSGGLCSAGGDEQAWLYRENMRDVWEAEPGALSWLKKLTA